MSKSPLVQLEPSLMAMPDAPHQAELGFNALAGLLEEFRKGKRTADVSHGEGWRCHLQPLDKAWDEAFPGFPRTPTPYASLSGFLFRGVRDAYLKRVIVRLLQPEEDQPGVKTLVNPVCVFGRHARHLASRLGPFKVIGSDIQSWADWFYGHLPGIRSPKNYQFRREDIFRPAMEPVPTAVVFFGACGSLSDAAIDYAVRTGSPYLFCRTCCHDNIGGNTTIEHRPTALNWAFRTKNLVFAAVRRRLKGHYFSEDYSADQYPRSRAARELCNATEWMEMARRSTDSDLCRSLIDLDRYLRLAESGYRAWYRGEVFVARKMEGGF